MWKVFPFKLKVFIFIFSLSMNVAQVAGNHGIDHADHNRGIKLKQTIRSKCDNVIPFEYAYVDVVVQFYPWCNSFLFLFLFWDMVTYDNQFQTKEKKF